MGSKFARLACGTKRKVRAAAPWERAGIEKPPVAARLPTPANPFNRVLRCIGLSQSRVVMAVPPISLAEGSTPNEVKRASQTDSDPPLFACKWYASATLPCKLLEFRSFFWVPPTTADNDAFGQDLAVADQVLADDVNIVELALLDRDQGGVSDAPRLEAAEFGTPQRHRRIDRRRRDHIGERHAHAQEFGHGRHLIEGRAVDA